MLIFIHLICFILPMPIIDMKGSDHNSIVDVVMGIIPSPLSNLKITHLGELHPLNHSHQEIILWLTAWIVYPLYSSWKSNPIHQGTFHDCTGKNKFQRMHLQSSGFESSAICCWSRLVLSIMLTAWWGLCLHSITCPFFLGKCVLNTFSKKGSWLYVW